MMNETDSEPVLLPNVHFANTSSFKFKTFIKEKVEADALPVKEIVKLPKVSGLTVKRQYDEIVCDASTSSATGVGSCGARRIYRNKKPKTFDKALTVHALMRAVERDDIKTVGDYLENDLSFVINSRDEFGWSALMCASCAGAEKVVKLFLNYNFDLSIKDKKGNNCLSLARGRGNKNIVQLIEQHYDKNLNDRLSSNDPVIIDVDSYKTQEDSGTYYCEACKESIPYAAKPNHMTSTIHNFNSARKSGLKTSYGISESNKGFQMLLKTGWDREKGLGPEGEGLKFPPKVILKQDRTGLGVKKYVAKVTHNVDDVQKPRLERTNTINKRHKEKKLRKDKMKERELRRILS